MEYNLITNIESCYTEIPNLLYYSHIPTAIIVLFFGIFLLFKNKENKLLSTILFSISIIFSVWTLFDIMLWRTYSSVFMMSVWSFFPILYVLMFIMSLYFIYVFIDKKDISIYKKYFLSILLFPIILLTPTKYNLTGFDIANCQPIEGTYFYIYQYSLSIFIIIWILVLVYLRYKKAQQEQKKQILYIGSGILLFLIAFSWSEISGSITENFTVTQYGLFGAPIFIGFLVYSIVKFKTFNIKLIATQALVWGLVALIGSQFFFIKVTTNFILNGVTFVGIIILGQFLIKSVKREVMQREQLQILSEQLFDANEKLKGLDKLKTEFVSLASHQLRSPLTAIKGYTSMLLEGDYGEINPQAKEKIGLVMESSNNLTLVVDDLLNVSKIESGGMKYVMEKFDFGELAINIAKELSITAEGKGLKLICSVPNDKKYFINGDKEKLRQILINLIDNSIKYTKEGQIEVNIHSDNGKIILIVKDTGVGIEKGKEEALFDKFTRGEGAKLNTSGSGLGLYLVREIAKAHNGRVWAESEGIGKGSTFFVELNEVK